MRRAGPGADRLPQRLERLRADPFPLRPEVTRPGYKRIYGKRGALLWQQGRAARRPTTAATPSSSSQAVELLHPDGAVAVAGRGARAPLRRGPAARCARCWRRSSRTPTVCGPADGQAAGRPGRRDAARRRPGDRHDAWAWMCRARASSCSMPPNVSGWDDTRWLDTATFRGRWEAQRICDPARLDRARRPAPPTRRNSCASALAFWGDPANSVDRARPLERYAADTLATADQQLDADEYPRERPADARRDVPRLPDELIMIHDSPATSFTRARPAARPARACPRSSPACRCPPARACRAARCCARRRDRARRLRRGMLAPPPSRRASRSAARRTGDACSSTSSCAGGVDALRLLAPVGDPRTASCGRPRRRRRRRALPEDAALQWHPARGALERPARRGKVTVLPAIGYTDPDQSHFTSRHFWEVGALDPTGRTGWLGRCSTSSARPTTRCRACRWTAALADAGTALRPGRGRRRPESTASGPRASGARRTSSPCPHGLGARSAGRARPRAGAAATPRRSPAACATRSRPRPATTSPRTRPPPPTRSATTVPPRLAGLRRDARRRPADPRRLDRAPGELRHARQPGRDAAEEPRS